MVLLAVTIGAACVTGRGREIAVEIIPPTTTSTTTTTTAPVTTTTELVATPPTTPFVAPGCQRAAPEDVAVIEASLVDGAYRLGEAFVGKSGERTYIVADIYDAAGNQLSTADVWAVDRGQVFTLSGGARRYDPDLPEAARLPYPSTASDPVPLLLIAACVVPSLRGG